MKAIGAKLPRQLAAPDPAIRFYLFYGPDEAGSRALGDQLAVGLGNAEKISLTGAQLKTDPAALADEARAIGLFGGARLLWIESASDENIAAIEGLLDAPAVECPAVAIGGGLRKSSALVKLAEASALALSHISYVPEGRDAERLVIDIARAEGLRIEPDIAARIAAGCANDRAMAAQELAKLALFVDAAPDRPRALDRSALDAIGADYAEGDALRVGDHALAGDLVTLMAELERLDESGAEPIPIIRAIQRRLLMLAPLRARIEHGENVDTVMASMGKALFWKDKALIRKLLVQWSAVRLAELVDRTATLELRLMRSGLPGHAALGEELVAIARVAGRR